MQLFEASGAPLAYAKLGWSPSTAPLVRHEAGTLSRVAERGALPGVRSAALLGHGTWRGHPYLVLEPLPAAITTLPRTVAPPPGSRAVAGTLMEQPVADSPWWRQLTARVAELGQGRIDEAARRGVALLRGRVAERRWTFGAWHGDWTWWNVGECDSELWAWDWEHYAASAPYGFDDLHWSVSMECQILGKPLPEAVSRARQTLGRAQARSDDLMLAYLTEMAVRSAEVSAHRPDAPLELHEGLTAALNAEIARG